MKKIARTKLSERNMHWEESYTENTAKFKEMYEDIIGEGSYFRWEGKDVESGDEYFAIVGPAKMKTPKASWFAGCRKLPSDWAAGGKYFSEIKEAMNYANETWGIPIPSDFKWSYDSSDLKDIADKMDEWRNESVTEASNHNVNAIFKINGENKMSNFHFSDFPIYIHKNAMGGPLWKKREGYIWYDADQLAGGSEEFDQMAANTEELQVGKNAALNERDRRRLQISSFYGTEYLNADFYQVFLCYKPDEGMYLVSIGPYCGHTFEKAFDKFGIFKKKLNIFSQDRIEQEINNFIAEYLHDYGVHLNIEDIRVGGTEESEVVIDLNKSGTQKVREGDIYQKNLNYYKNTYGVNTMTEAHKKFQEEVAEYKKKKNEWQKAHAEELASGKALVFSIPHPPKIDLKKRRVGQQQFSAIYKETPSVGATEEEKQSLKFGFDSLQEALDYVMATMPGEFPIQTIASVKNVTSADLKAAREKQAKSIESKQVAKEPTKTKPTSQDITTKPSKEKATQPKDKKIIAPKKEKETLQEETISQKPSRTIEKKNIDETIDEISDEEWERIKNQEFGMAKPINSESELVSKTMLNLVKLAENLDNENKPEDAEEIHKILRKHMGKKHD